MYINKVKEKFAQASNDREDHPKKTLKYSMDTNSYYKVQVS